MISPWRRRRHELRVPVAPPIAPEPPVTAQDHVAAALDAIDAAQALGRARVGGSWEEWLSASARHIAARRGART